VPAQCTFGLLRGPRALNWADGVVFLSLVGLLASAAWLGHALCARAVRARAPSGGGSLPWNLPYYPARGLLRMCVALGPSVVFTLIVASWATK
jgi:hypothetical protein